MRTVFIYSALSFFLSSACGSSKETAAPAPANQNSSDMALSDQDNQPQVTNYRLIVSFISIGEGTDPQGREMLDGVISSWKEKKGKTIEMESIPWGREGEADFCFMLKELDDKEQVTFINEIKSVFKDKNLIQIFENQPCTHKR